MAIFTEPKKWGVIPGSAADVGEIQEKGSALYPSIADLWPAIYQLALSKGGKAPERTSFNAFLKMIMERLYFIERGGVWSYDATADYPAGAVVGHSGSLYLALKDNGSGTDAGAVSPDADSAVWQKLPTLADVAKAFLLISDAEADYLKKSDAADTYLSKDDASDTYLPKEDLSSQIKDSVGSAWYDLYPDGAEAHNSMWGGRDITAAFNAGTVSANIKNGTFKDIFPGDYITKQVTISGTTYNVNWVIADCDYWWHKGDNTAMETHHVVIVPQAPIFNANMNNDNVTTGGYAGSRMYRETIPACATGIVNAFGSEHILTFRDLINNNVNTNVASTPFSSWAGQGQGRIWVSCRCNLMEELMVYGAPIWQSGADNSGNLRQLSVFRMSAKAINPNRTNWWLRDVVSSAYFAVAYGGGFAGTRDASAVFGVRPFALLV